MGEKLKLFVSLVVFLSMSGAVLNSGLSAADPSSSSSYRIDESFIGPGGNLDSTSSSYQLESGQQSVGNTGVSDSSSTNYKTQSGFTTTADPRLRCVINSGSVGLGSLSTSVSSTGTVSFSVLNYTAYGYTVSILGSPPGNGSHALNALSSNTASQTGTEQFGINLAANTLPTNFGAGPVQVPDSSFSSGQAAANYSTANQYRYVPGETIAFASKSSGQTDYTISYLVNVATDTPGGRYSGNQEVLCIGTY